MFLQATLIKLKGSLPTQIKVAEDLFEEKRASERENVHERGSRGGDKNDAKLRV